MKKIINVTKTILVFLAILFSATSIFADINLNNLYFNPAIVSAGDEVDVVVEYEAANLNLDRIGNTEYKFLVELEADDDLSLKYITFINKFGDDLKGSVLSGEVYNKVFRIKVSQDAIPANYQFKLVGRWYKNGYPEEIIREIKFTIPVKKDGIVLNVANLNTNPSQVRPGDNFVVIKTYIENSGEKQAKAIKIDLVSDNELISSTYTDNNRKFVGVINPSESKEISFFLNVDEKIKAGLYNLMFNMSYMDIDNNWYNKEIEVPFLIKDRSYIEVVKFEGSSLAGDNSELKVYIKNTGTQSAESVDVRILKEASQPFEFDVRSSYVGELMPGEEGVAIFNFKTNDNAEIKTHDFKLLIRAKGDTDEGDDSNYTYNRRAQFEVTGVAENKYIKYGLIGLFLIVFYVIISKFTKNKNNSKNKKD